MLKTIKPQQEGGPKTPAWIVSFTDMITLLLAFFVMLQAFAREQDPELFLRGQGSFKRHIAGLGIPDLLFGKEYRLEGRTRQVYHPTEEGRTSRLRLIDAEDEKIREIFQAIQREIDTKTSEINLQQRQVISTPILFEENSASLSAPAREYLRSLGANLRETLDPRQVRIYVVGSAPDNADGMDSWTLSARRAEVAAGFLREALSTEASAQWPLSSLGIGPASAGDSRGREFIRIVIIELEQ